MESLEFKHFYYPSLLRLRKHCIVSNKPKAENLSVHLRAEIVAEIIARGTALDKKKGSYAAMILEKWFADGCPPISAADDALLKLKSAPTRVAAKRAS